MMIMTLSLQTNTNILPVSIVLHQVVQEHQTDLLHLTLQVHPIRVSGHENSCGEGMSKTYRISRPSIKTRQSW